MNTENTLYRFVQVTKDSLPEIGVEVTLKFCDQIHSGKYFETGLYTKPHFLIENNGIIAEELFDNVKLLSPIPEQEQEEVLLSISKFAVESKYKTKTLKDETAHWDIDLPKLIEHLKQQYILIKKQ